MDCTQRCHEAHTRGPLPIEGLQAELAQRVRDRQAAVMYLQAAGLTDDPIARARLRRRSVQLLSGGSDALRLPRAC
jgi:hypothetical protein